MLSINIGSLIALKR